MIEVKHLYKSFGDKEVLKDINAVFEDGKTNLIIGQSGSGKTVPSRTSSDCLNLRVEKCSMTIATSSQCRRKRKC